MQVLRNQEMTYAAKRIHLEISEISYALLDKEWNLQNMRAAFTRLYFPLRGEGILRFGDEEVRLLPGHIYIVPSGLNFSGFCPHALEKIFIHLTVTRPDGSDLLEGVQRCLSLADREQTVQEVAQLYEGQDIRSVLRLKLLLWELLDEALTQCPPQNRALHTDSELTKAALSYIDSHLCASLTIGELASALFCSKLTLQRRFREDVGKSIGQYIDDCVMSRAERELLDPARSIKDISDGLGFCDQFYFSRKFTAAHGFHPRQFRQMHNV